MPVCEIADLAGEHDTLLWRIIRHHVMGAYARKDMSSVTKVGIDETSTRKGHNYISAVNRLAFCAAYAAHKQSILSKV